MRLSRLLALPLAALAVSLAVAADPPAAAVPPPHPLIPLEEEPTDPALAKIVLVASGPFYKPGEHEYQAGVGVLRHLLKQTPGVFPVVAQEWPTKPTTFAGAKAVLFFGNGAAAHPMITRGHAAEVQKLADAGVGLVAVHQLADFPKDFTDRAKSWLGGAYVPGVSKRAHWVFTFDAFPDHPVTRGVKPFTIDDGWLTHSQFADGMKGVTPLLRTRDPKKDKVKVGAGGPEDVVSWAFDRPAGGRSLVFTGAHLYKSWAEEGYRRFLTNGVLWAAGVEVPKDGAKVDLDAATLQSFLAPKK